VDVTTTGFRFPAVRFVAGERLSSANYARALGVDDPLLSRAAEARGAGYRGRLVPPAMLGFHLAVAADALVDDLGFTWGKTLNLGIDVDWAGVPVTEEDLLEAHARVAAAWERPAKDGGTRQFLRVQTDFDLEGRTVCRWNVLFTERRLGEPVQGSDGEAGEDEDFGFFGQTRRTPLPAGRPEARVDTPVVDRLSLARLSVSLDNPDPLHVDDGVARAAGFEQVIGHGAAVVGLLHEPVRTWAGIETPVRLKTRQSAPFGIGDTLTAEAGDVTCDDGGSTWVRTTVARQDDVLIGTADIYLHTSS